MSHRKRHASTRRRGRATRRRGQRRASDRAAFLATITGLLAGSLDLERTLASIASIALPHEGGWCIVDVVEDGRLRRVAVVHTDPGKQALARRLESGWPPERDDPLGGLRVMRTGVSEVIGPVTPAMLRSVARTPRVLETLTRLGMGSLLVVPLLGGAEVLGAVTYVSPASSYVFRAGDVAFAEEVARRAVQAIENARLYQASQRAARLADEANRAKMSFLATLSHELRTPLNAIGGYAQMLAEGVRGPLTAAQVADVGRIRANERHLLGLVDAVLGYARLDAGHTEYVLADVAMTAVLDDVQAVVAPIATAKGIRCDVIASPPPPIVVRADRGKLAQILVNLVNNAVKFSPRGAHVVVASRVGERVVLVSVADRGLGIGAAQLAKLFQPFVQAHRRGTAGEEGTGLGLAISRRLARDMGGDVTAVSRPGVGSTFTVSLPLAGQAAAAAAR